MKRMHYYGAMAGYLLLLGGLMDFRWSSLLQPLPLAAVLGGCVILTASQYQRSLSLERLLGLCRWNAFAAGLLTSLLWLLAELTGAHPGPIGARAMAEQLVPLLYGSLIYLIPGLGNSPLGLPPSGEDPQIRHQSPLLPEVAEPILTARDFSPREIHVALKVLEGRTNKEIAAQLYISEATVKKHVQNIFRKCGAADRADFHRLYLSWAGSQGRKA